MALSVDRLCSHSTASPSNLHCRHVSKRSRGATVRPSCASGKPTILTYDVQKGDSVLVNPVPAREVQIVSLKDSVAQELSCSESLEPNFDERKVLTRFIAETLLPTRHGRFRLRGYKHSVDGGTTFTEPSAIISGRVEGQENVPVRVHDACFTSEVLGSLKCDCAEQLQLSLEMIRERPPGMVIYLQQEGRGIGLANKIAAYSLQEQGLDTVDANRALGLPDDCREYTSVRNIIRDLGVKSIQLMTNNPRKIKILEALGIRITGRVPVLIQPGEHNLGYLEAKKERMDHMLDGSWCYWNHDGEPTQPSAVAYSKGDEDACSMQVGWAFRRASLLPAARW